MSITPKEFPSNFIHRFSLGKRLVADVSGLHQKMFGEDSASDELADPSETFENKEVIDSTLQNGVITSLNGLIKKLSGDGTSNQPSVRVSEKEQSNFSSDIESHKETKESSLQQFSALHDRVINASRNKNDNTKNTVTSQHSPLTIEKQDQVDLIKESQSVLNQKIQQVYGAKNSDKQVTVNIKEVVGIKHMEVKEAINNMPLLEKKVKEVLVKAISNATQLY